jgi:hypothetical protein
MFFASTLDPGLELREERVVRPEYQDAVVLEVPLALIVEQVQQARRGILARLACQERMEARGLRVLIL